VIVLDTNVVSEWMRPAPDPAVMAWGDAQPSSELYLCSIVAAELLYGLARWPDSARKRQASAWFQSLLQDDFAGRILDFDLTAATAYADLVAQREKQGRPISMADAQIAAICLTHDAALATRNEKDFEGLGLSVINPWNQ